MTEEVKFIRGNDRINQLAQRPDIADGVARVRAEMAEADHTYAMGLAALRQAAELTQVELDRRLAVIRRPSAASSCWRTASSPTSSRGATAGSCSLTCSPMPSGSTPAVAPPWTG